MAAVAAEVYDVVIVGSGWSGLAASNYLIDAGITDNLLVVEARDRIGGRTHTVNDAFKEGHPIEVGSQWIYSGTYIWDLFNSLGIAHDSSIWEWDTLGLYEESVGALSKTEQDTLINDVYRKRFIPYAYKNAAFDVDWIELLSEYYLELGDTLTSRDQQAINALVTQGIIIEYGSPLNETNSETTKSNLGRGDWRSIDNTAVPGGTGGGYTASITQGLADNLAPEQIRLNAPVTKIDRTSSDGIVKIHVSNNDDDGEESIIQSRSVLVTVPVGVLKQSSIEFLPPLSDKKLEAIDMIPVGVLNKVIMYWDQTIQDVSWWPDGQVDMALITKEGISSNDFTYFYNDHEHAANKDYHAMTAFIGGKAAEFYESYSDQETIKLVLTNLRNMFGEDVPSPNQYFVSRWKSDEYAKGAYSFNLVGSVTTKFRRALAEPVGNNLFFAGEATDTDDWFATTAGAYSTGIKASNFIAESGVLDNELQATCAALNAECGNESQLPCCNGLTCALDSILGRKKVCYLSTVVLPRPVFEPEQPVLSAAQELFTNDPETKSSSSIIFSGLALIGLSATLMFMMTI